MTIDTNIIAETIRNNPTISLDALQAQFQDVDSWTLRQIRRDVQRDVAQTPVAPEHVLDSSAFDGLSRTAKTALLNGFFRPVTITLPEMRPVKPVLKKAGYEYLVLSDIHAGDEDNDALDVVIQVGQAADVDEVLLNGDAFDCHSLSKYTPASDRPLRWADERERALPVIARVRAAFADRPAQFIFGNHDTRPERYIASVAPPLQGLFSLPYLLGIEDLDFTFPEHNRIVIEDKLLVLHGSKVRKDAGASVKEEVKDAGMSVVMGHVHRRALYELTNTAQIIRNEQPLIGVELGCLCNLTPSYLEPEKTSNWQHGAAIITVYDGGYVDVEPIRIFNGKAFFRGRMFISRHRKGK